MKTPFYRSNALLVIVLLFSPLVVKADNVCVLSSTSAGVLTANAQGTVIGSTQTGGMSGSLSVSCTTTGTISIANPVAIGAGAQAVFNTGANYSAAISQGGVIKASITKTNVSTSFAISSGVYQINTTIDNGAVALPPGDYAVTVTTTLIAN